MVSSVDLIINNNNPFTQRGRITDPARFTGRWREVSLLFTRLEQRRPVLISGSAGIGKSSLLTHVAQSAAVNLEEPDLLSLFVDLAVLPNAAACYELVITALAGRGDNSAALEIALLQNEQIEGPVLLCLDSVETAIAAGWGERLIEQLARVARHVTQGHNGADQRPPFLLVVAMRSPVPTLSEPFTELNMGAITPTELRLLVDAYLDGTEVQFSSYDLRALQTLSMGHPGYVQRAAFHLFQARTGLADYNWPGAYLEEVRNRPISGAPLPPALFEGDTAIDVLAMYESSIEVRATPKIEPPHLEGPGSVLAVLLPLVVAGVVFQLSGSWIIAAGVFIAGIGIAIGIRRATAGTY